MKLAEMPELLTPREVAEILRVSILTVKRWSNKGKLRAMRINSRGDRRYHKKEILDLLQIK